MSMISGAVTPVVSKPKSELERTHEGAIAYPTTTLRRRAMDWASLAAITLATG